MLKSLFYVPYDVASISRDESVAYYKRENVVRTGEQIYPDIGSLDEIPDVYRSPKLSGVDRNTLTRVDPRYFSRGDIVQSRKDVQTAVDEILRGQNYIYG